MSSIRRCTLALPLTPQVSKLNHKPLPENDVDVQKENSFRQYVLKDSNGRICSEEDVGVELLGWLSIN